MIKKSTTKSAPERLQDKVNRIVRIIDKNLPCIATGCRFGMQSGHVFAVGGNRNFRFNLHNIHRQSGYSNCSQEDDGKMEAGVSKEYGSEYLDFITSLKQTPQPSYSKVQYLEFISKASLIITRLEKSNDEFDMNDVKFNMSDRIALRNAVNEELGIYEEKYQKFE